MSSDFDEWRRHLDAETRTTTRAGDTTPAIAVPVLTILCHADPSRVGEQAWLVDLAERNSVGLSRIAPLFTAPDGGPSRPLADPRISRRPLRVSPRPGGLRIEKPPPGPMRIEVDGDPLEGARTLSESELESGIALLLGGRVALLLRYAEPVLQDTPSFGMIGESPEMLRLRGKIEAVADLEIPVLLRGESGTGKELVAGALQASSKRRGRVFLSLNMGAVPPSLAASELFGAAKGAFSGAERRRQGYFRQADGGTLFLDEIGETSSEVQTLLLRALENGEIQPVGAESPSKVDVRLLAATDADLEHAVHAGTFHEALLYRLRSFEIHLPPLRERPEDLGRLFFFFLRHELRQIGDERRLENLGPYGRAFVPARLLAAMVRYPWPGNVRELRNVVRQLAISSRGEAILDTGHWLDEADSERQRPEPEAAETQLSSFELEITKSRRAASRYRDPSDVGDDELIAALREKRWNLTATAEMLGVSRGSLYVLIEESKMIRKAVDLQPEEISAAIEEHGLSLEKLAVTLEVSKQGLKRRMTQLGLRRAESPMQ